MKNLKVLTVLMALVCALSLGGLVACGGSGDSGGSGGESKQQAEPVVTDEDLIKADAEDVIGTAVSPETMLQGLKDDEQMASFAEMGFDLEVYAKNMADKFKFEVVSVDVDGDTAVAHTKLTMPNFSDESLETLTDEKMKEVTKGKDASKMSQEEQVGIFADMMNAVLNDPAFPTTTEDIDIDYVKNGDTWEMKDKEAITAMLGTAMNTTGSAQAE